MKPSNPPPRALAAALSVAMIAAAIDLFYTGVTRSPHEPPWVDYVLGVVFLAVGAHALAVAFGRAGRGLWVGFIFFAGIACVFWWIAIGSDPRECVASIGPFILPGRVCKIGFGFFAALSTALALHVGRPFVRRGRARSHY